MLILTNELQLEKKFWILRSLSFQSLNPAVRDPRDVQAPRELSVRLDSSFGGSSGPLVGRKEIHARIL